MSDLAYMSVFTKHQKETLVMIYTSLGSKFPIYLKAGGEWIFKIAEHRGGNSIQLAQVCIETLFQRFQGSASYNQNLSLENRCIGFVLTFWL